MKTHFLVTPINDELFKKLEGCSLVIQTNKVNTVDSIVEKSNIYNFHIHTVWIQTEVPLSNVVFKENWPDIPVALQVSSIGIFHHFLNQLPVIRKLNLRVCIPLEEPKQYTDVRILSSLGLDTAVLFSSKTIDWDRLNDLMVYALLNIRPHGNIAPFNYLGDNFVVHKRNDYSSVYFNNPQNYLHIDDSGRIALTQEDLVKGNFISEKISDLNTIEDNLKYLEKIQSWKNCFIQPTECGCCEGWRICLGKYRDRLSVDKGCKEFFADFLKTIEKNNLLKQKRDNRKIVWQP